MSASDYQGIAESAAANNGIPISLFDSLVSHESSWNSYAVSLTGAVGLAQIEPSNWSALGITNPFDPTQNLNGGAELLAQDYKQFGNWYDALRAYNAGATGAAKDPSASAGYANTILEDAGMAGVNTPGDTGANTTYNNAPWYSDPLAYIWGKIKAANAYIWPIIIAIIIIVALGWFGFQQLIKE